MVHPKIFNQNDCKGCERDCLDAHGQLPLGFCFHLHSMEIFFTEWRLQIAKSDLSCINPLHPNFGGLHYHQGKNGRGCNNPPPPLVRRGLIHIWLENQRLSTDFQSLYDIISFTEYPRFSTRYSKIFNLLHIRKESLDVRIKIEEHKDLKMELKILDYQLKNLDYQLYFDNLGISA